MRYSANWGSHIPILVKVMNLSQGPVLELGMGLFSTPLLHWLCLEQKRQMVSYDNSLEWVKMNKTFESPIHRILYTQTADWESAGADRHWGLALVDHHPGIRRGIDAIRLKDKADYVVVHDSDLLTEYGYENIYQHFKYSYDWKRRKPWTTVLSNFYSLEGLR